MDCIFLFIYWLSYADAILVTEAEETCNLPFKMMPIMRNIYFISISFVFRRCPSTLCNTAEFCLFYHLFSIIFSHVVTENYIIIKIVIYIDWYTNMTHVIYTF